MYSSKATISYEDQGKVVALVDRELVRYYLSMIPKAYYVQPQMYPAHITVVRSEPVEIISDRSAWKKYVAKRIEFQYDGVIQFREPYFFMNVVSEQIAAIRKELGLPRFRDGYSCYHITLGNLKEEAAKLVCSEV